MSGSSLDGLDICHVEFQTDIRDHKLSEVRYKILHADCIPFDRDFRQQLKNAASGNAYELAQLHTEVGRYFGSLTRSFLETHHIDSVDLLSSHGHTVFHQPEKGFTLQIGCGAEIAAQTQCKVVCDLRSSDVAYGGQGAPIVPMAEKYLFPEHRIFLNIGGIANISFHGSESERESGRRKESGVVAFDVCASNTLLNHLARHKGMEYDKGGILAKSGKIIPALLEQLNAIPFLHREGPKSLGTEHIYSDWLPLLDNEDYSTEDELATVVEHIALQTAKAISHGALTMDHRLLITGGGALNQFLVERIQQHSPVAVDVPDEATVQFKEALAMAFLGLLRVLEIPNGLPSVTGASRPACGGSVYLP